MTQPPLLHKGSARSSATRVSQFDSRSFRIDSRVVDNKSLRFETSTNRNIPTMNQEKLLEEERSCIRTYLCNRHHGERRECTMCQAEEVDRVVIGRRIQMYRFSECSYIVFEHRGNRNSIARKPESGCSPSPDALEYFQRRFFSRAISVLRGDTSSEFFPWISLRILTKFRFRDRPHRVCFTVNKISEQETVSSSACNSKARGNSNLSATHSPCFRDARLLFSIFFFRTSEIAPTSLLSVLHLAGKDLPVKKPSSIILLPT